MLLLEHLYDQVAPPENIATLVYLRASSVNVLSENYKPHTGAGSRIRYTYIYPSADANDSASPTTWHVAHGRTVASGCTRTDSGFKYEYSILQDRPSQLRTSYTASMQAQEKELTTWTRDRAAPSARGAGSAPCPLPAGSARRTAQRRPPARASGARTRCAASGGSIWLRGDASHNSAPHCLIVQQLTPPQTNLADPWRKTRRRAQLRTHGTSWRQCCRRLRLLASSRRPCVDGHPGSGLRTSHARLEHCSSTREAPKTNRQVNQISPTMYVLNQPVQSLCHVGQRTSTTMNMSTKQVSTYTRRGLVIRYNICRTTKHRTDDPHWQTHGK